MSLPIFLHKINYNSFSHSEGWVGYFQAKNIQDISLIHSATGLVKQFFGENLDDFFMISALALNEDVEFYFGDLEETDKLYFKMLEVAIEKGFAQKYNKDFKDYFENDSELPAKLLAFHFQTQDFMLFCEVLMAYYFGRIHGQICFLINPKLQIALYPHDDTGFGCIDLNNDKTLLINFLKFCEKHEGFLSHIHA